MYDSLKKNKLSLLSIVLLALIAAGVLYWRHPSFERNFGGGNGAIFSVAAPSGTTYFTVMNDGKIGVGVDNPAAALDVGGAVRLGKSLEGCGPTTAGEIAYNPDNTHFWGCNGTEWRQLDN